MVISQKYDTQSQILANYNYTDVANGTGFVTYYGADVNVSGAVSYVLTSNVVYSDNIYTSTTLPADESQVSTKRATHTFDLSTFNIPQTAKGTAVINVPFEVATIGYAHLVLILKKNTTTIATVQTEEINATIKLSLLNMTIPETHFKIGDYLSLVVEVWGHNLHNIAAGAVYVGHDPKDRTMTTLDSSQIRLDMPFRLDL